MSDFDLIHRPVLAGARPLVSDRIKLTPLPEGTVLQVFGPASATASLDAAMATSALSLRANGPGQWYLVGDRPATRVALPDGFVLVDQSHGRVRIAIEGSVVEDVLAKGTGIDLSRVEIGQATTTLVGHVSAHITRTAADRFELMPLRSFAETLWHDLGRMAAEHLVDAGGV